IALHDRDALEVTAQDARSEEPAHARAQDDGRGLTALHGGQAAATFAARAASLSMAAANFLMVAATRSRLPLAFSASVFAAFRALEAAWYSDSASSTVWSMNTCSCPAIWACCRVSRARWLLLSVRTMRAVMLVRDALSSSPSVLAMAQRLSFLHDDFHRRP